LGSLLILITVMFFPCGKSTQETVEYHPTDSIMFEGVVDEIDSTKAATSFSFSLG
jgi:hypothetical protein